MFRDISRVDAVPSHIEPPSRLFGLSPGKTNFRSNLLSQDSSRLNMQFGNRNIVDRTSEHGIRTSMVQSTTIGTRSFGFQSRNLTSDSTTFPEGSFRLNQEIRQRSNSASAVSKPFWPAVRNTTLTTGLQVQDSVRYNDIVDNDGFRRPRGFGIIRGRNSTLSSRLFHHQNAETHFKDLSNINGFNVSHISRREGDTLSESRLPLGMRSNWMENQSLSGSVISVVSMKAQFMNLLENLHHSILSIGPHATAEAVRSEFDKAKQGLENMSEMSFAPTIKPADTASVVSQSSKYICPPSNSEPPTRTCTIDGGSLHLKSSNEMLKTLISNKANYNRRKFNLSPHVEEREERDAVITSSRNEGSDDEENSSFVFKKPKPQASRRYTPRMKIKAAPAVKKSLPKEENNAINLKQWYPVAIGATLAFCGVDENGASVKTDAVKKRLNNRKVELITGLDCNLIGSPSTMISALPQKILKLLKNGLTDRWRVLQRELLNCQTVEEETKKRKSKSPRTRDAEEKIEQKPAGKENSKRPKVISTPKRRGRELHTRSGRAVKPPGLFWLANGSNEITSSFELSETTIREVPTKASRKSNTGSPEKKPKRPPSLSPSKKSKKPNEESPKKKAKKASPGQKYKKPSPNKKQSKASPKQKNKKVVEESPGKKEKKTSEETPIRRDKKASEASPCKKEKKTTSEETPVRRYKKAVGSPKEKEKTSRVASPSKSKTTEGSTGKGNKKQPVEKKGKDSKQEKEVTVHSSTEDAKLKGKARPTLGKRKREARAEADSVEPKKSKLEKKTNNQVESTVASTETETKGGKNTKKGRLAICPVGSKSKGKKSPTVKKTTTAKKKTDKNAAGKSHNETEEFTEFEKNFEFKLDDIEIPEIANVSSNPHLSRSQLRLVCMETPPLKYFNSNLRLMGSTTPMRSPDWCISQRTASEVKQFQRRREEAFKKRVKAETKKTVVTEKIVQNKDVKRVMQWVAEKNVRSPQWNSKVLQYVIPSRKRMEEAEDEEGEDADTEFF